MTTATAAARRTVTEAQYRQLIHDEGARLHQSSRRSQHLYFLPRRNAWVTARAGRRRGTFELRFYGRCPCEDS